MASNAETSPSMTTTEEWKEALKDLLIDSGTVADTRERLRTGTYAEGSIVKKNGVVCVAKTIQTAIFATDVFRKQFVQSCLQLNCLRHPNIVQLLGVQISDFALPPMLIYEHVPISLSSCLMKYTNIPDYTVYSILLEVSYALKYLHEHKPALVHGHLCANNILLTESLHVKVSDCIRFSSQVPHKRNSPYVPPEEDPQESGDIFNFGDLMIQIVLQREPSPLEEKEQPQEDSPEEMVFLTEVQRRKKFFDEIREDHPLKELASSCLQDDPAVRPTASNLAVDLEKIVAEHPSEHKTILDVLAILGQLSLSKDTVTSLKQMMTAKNNEVDSLREQIEPLKQELESKDDALAAEKQEVEAYKQALQSKEGRIKAYESGLRSKEALIKAKDREVASKRQELSAKENLLRAAHNRIEVLEHQLMSSKKKSVHPPSTLPRSNKSPSPSVSSDVGSSPPASADDSSGVLLRKNKGRLGRGNISSDGYLFQGLQIQKSKSMDHGDSRHDPVLAKIFARQKQKIDTPTENQQLDSITEPEKNPVPSDETTPELKRILEKRKSFLDEEGIDY